MKEGEKGGMNKYTYWRIIEIERSITIEYWQTEVDNHATSLLP